jgi:hypothetical protein
MFALAPVAIADQSRPPSYHCGVRCAYGSRSLILDVQLVRQLPRHLGIAHPGVALERVTNLFQIEASIKLARVLSSTSANSSSFDVRELPSNSMSLTAKRCEPGQRAKDDRPELPDGGHHHKPDNHAAQHTAKSPRLLPSVCASVRLPGRFGLRFWQTESGPRPCSRVARGQGRLPCLRVIAWGHDCCLLFSALLRL